VVENNRGNFIDLITHLLWQDISPYSDSQSHEDASKSEGAEDARSGGSMAATSATKTSKNKKKAKAKDARVNEGPGDTAETKAEISRRLNKAPSFSMPLVQKREVQLSVLLSLTRRPLSRTKKLVGCWK